MKTYIGISVLGLVAGICLGGCLLLPHTPEASVYHLDEDSRNPENITLGAWLPDGLEKMAEKLEKRSSRIEVVSATAFRDTVFPDPFGGRTLADLQESATRERLIDTEPDYLVAFSRYHSTDESDSTMVGLPYGGLLGHWDIDEDLHVSALILNVEDMSAMDLIIAKCTGSSDVIMGGVVAVGTYSRVAHGLTEALADEIVATLKNANPTGPIRVVLMRAEDWDTGRTIFSGQSE